MIIGSLSIRAPSISCVVEALSDKGRDGMNEVAQLAFERAECTILVIIKLDPMATVLDNARMRPIYLSSNMRNYRNVEGGEKRVQMASLWITHLPGSKIQQLHEKKRSTSRRTTI